MKPAPRLAGREAVDKFIGDCDAVLAEHERIAAKEQGLHPLLSPEKQPPGTHSVGKPAPARQLPPLPPAKQDAQPAPTRGRSIDELIDLASGGDADAEQELRDRTGHSSQELRTAKKSGVKLPRSK